LRPARFIHDSGQLMGRHRRMGRYRIQLAPLWLVRRFPELPAPLCCTQPLTRHHPLRDCGGTARCAFFSNVIKRAVQPNLDVTERPAQEKPTNTVVARCHQSARGR
jgi:hypothetical protein